MLALIIIEKTTNQTKSHKSIQILDFGGRGKLGYPGKKLSEERKEPIKSTYIYCQGWNPTWTTLLEGKFSHNSCANPVPYVSPHHEVCNIGIRAHSGLGGMVIFLPGKIALGLNV